MSAPAPDLATVRGSVVPRIYTKPLVTGPPGDCPCGCALTPETSYGYRVIRFSRAIGWEPDDWQRFAWIHAGELLPDGRPRFRTLLIIIARQNGKTVWARILILFWMFIQRVGLVIATHTDRGQAKRSWQKVVDIAEADDWLKIELPKIHQRLQIGEEDFWNEHGSHFRFSAPNRRAGRGDTVNRGHLDELLEHANRDTIAAVEGAMRADRHAQLIATSNQGGRRAVVLKSMREAAIRFIETGQGNYRLGLLEWSAPPEARPTDLHALAQANPNLGSPREHGIDPEALLGDAMTAEAAGGEDLDKFRIEYMCIAVDSLAGAIDLEQWKDRGPRDDRPALNLAEHRDRLAVGIEVAEDGQHVTLAAGAVIDGLARTAILHAWDTTAAMRRELPEIIAKIRPRELGWLPNGPTAAVMVELAHPKNPPKDERGRPLRWPPRGTKLVEITTEITAVCMGFVEQLEADELRHDGHALGTAHAANAVKLTRGAGWIFARKGAGHVDGLYAMAIAVHLARALPPPPPPLKVVQAPTN